MEFGRPGAGTFPTKQNDTKSPGGWFEVLTMYCRLRIWSVGFSVVTLIMNMPSCVRPVPGTGVMTTLTIGAPLTSVADGAFADVGEDVDMGRWVLVIGTDQDI